jgi:ParB-like chromosome segregation protein Spo0J
VIAIDPPEDQTALLTDMLIINKHRKEISYLEEAQVYKVLHAAGLSQHDIATRMSVSDADVSLALSLLSADQRIQEAVNSGRVSPSAVEPLLSLPPEMQAELAPAAIRAKTVRNVKRLVDTAKKRRGLDKRNTDDQAVPDDVDPMEALALEELKAAEIHVNAASSISLTHPDLITQAREIGAKMRQMLGVYA